MLTKNFKRMMSLILERSSADPKGMLAAVGTDGSTTYYLMNKFDSTSIFPYAVNYTWRKNYSDPGIVLGSGSTAATEDDARLESIITAGLTVTVTQNSYVRGGVPCVDYNLAINNTGSAAATIAEIGFVQNLYAATASGATSGSYYRFLLDRTVLARPVTIPAGGTGIIRYTLKTEVS